MTSAAPPPVQPWEIDLDAVLAVLDPLDQWACQCHGASARLVNSDLFAEARVARGTCEGVFGQHSWVVLGNDCYDYDATIIDPTLWSYDDDVEGIWVGTMRDGKHHPHGQGSIWQWGKPNEAAPGEAVELTPTEPLSRAARDFLDLLGPLDRRGWMILASAAPVERWPAGEILAALDDTMPGIVPIDRMGMLTDRNPGGLYLRQADDG